MDRRRFLLGTTLAGLAAGFAAPAWAQTGRAGRVTAVDPEITELQRRTFDWFVHVTDRERGLTPDRWPTQSFCSVAAVGFALTCWPVGVERGWMTRAEARTRTLNTIRFFHDAPQGPEPTGVIGHKGFFYHFLDMETGTRFGQVELSTIDTSLLVAGMLFAARYFNRDHAEEAEIRRLAQAVYDRIEWNWVVGPPNRISMGWHPESGFISSNWHEYNEGMLILHLAMGSPTHPLGREFWDEWQLGYQASWTDRWGEPYLHYFALFVHQYSHMFVDYRGIQDAYMRGQSAMAGQSIDYFENSRRAVHGQRQYAIDNPGGWDGYSAEIWGLTACDGPGDFKQVIDAREREFFSYSARGPGDRDDGTIAPTAAMASYPFAPAEVTATLKAMKAQYGPVYTQWGFLDSFNPTLTEREGRLQHGQIVPGVGWIDGDYLGIDQGPIVVMIENARSELVWRHMRDEPNIIRGLKAAGFTGGWLDA
jgi:hypothetical protein